MLKVILTEEERFGETLAQGTEMLNRLITEAGNVGSTIISGLDAFKLYDTYGFPLELTQEMVAEQGLSVDTEAFAGAMEDQRQRARSARQETDYISGHDALFREIREEAGETNFVGYDVLEAKAGVLGIFRQGERIVSAVVGEEIEIVLDLTPCYAESGGQVNDYARLTAPGLDAEITGVAKPVENLFVHKGRIISGVLGQSCQPGRFAGGTGTVAL